MFHKLFSFLTQFIFSQQGSNPSNLRLFKSAMQSCFMAEDMFVTLSALVPSPMDWLTNTPPGDCPQFDLSDPAKVRAVLMELYHKGVTHFQHGALFKQDVDVARVSSWVVAESIKGAHRIFEDNDPELVKKLKETLSQNDALLKLGICGRVLGSRGGAGGGGGGQARGGRQGSNKGRGGKGAGGSRDNSHLRCFHCRQKVISFFQVLHLLQLFLFQGHLKPQCPKWHGKGKGKEKKSTLAAEKDN